MEGKIEGLVIGKDMEKGNMEKKREERSSGRGRKGRMNKILRRSKEKGKKEDGRRLEIEIKKS